MAHVTAGRPDSRLRSAWNWFVQDRTTGESTVTMPPNLPITLFWAATGVRVLVRPHGAGRRAVEVTAAGALTWWAADELLRGTSPLRRTLGAVTLAGLSVRLARSRRRTARAGTPMRSGRPRPQR